MAGKLVTAIFELIAVVIVARILAPTDYGKFVLILAYSDTIGKLTNFQAWQAIIKFGFDALGVQDVTSFNKLIKFGYILDASTAIIGFIIAVGFSGILVLYLGWDASMRPLIILYSWLILFNFNGTPTGVLRFFNRFDLLSSSSIFSAIIKMVGIGFSVLTKQGLVGFVWAYLISGILGQLYFVIISLFVLRKNGYQSFYLVPLKGLRQDFPGIWSFVWSTNIISTVRLGSTTIDLFIVEAVSSLEVVGIYRLAKSMGALLSIPFDPIYHAIYPEMAQLWSRHKRIELLTLIKRTTFIVAVCSLSLLIVFALVGYYPLLLSYGIEFMKYGLYHTTLFYLIAVAIGMIGLTLQPLILAMNMPKSVLIQNIIFTIVYMLLLIPASHQWQAPGAAAAYIAFMAASILGRFVIARSGWKSEYASKYVSSG